MRSPPGTSRRRSIPRRQPRSARPPQPRRSRIRRNGGYEPIGVEEIALGAMQLAIADTDTHWMQFLGNLGVHEAGYLDGGGKLVPKEGTPAPPGRGRDRRARVLARARCSGDFTTIDHLARACEPLADVRASFGIPERAR